MTAEHTSVFLGSVGTQPLPLLADVRDNADASHSFRDRASKLSSFGSRAETLEQNVVRLRAQQPKLGAAPRQIYWRCRDPQDGLLYTARVVRVEPSAG